MNKIWYLFIDGKSEGPWDFEELKRDTRITPDTWIWKEGFETWKKIRDVVELKKLFEDDPTTHDNEDELENLEKKTPQDELVLEMGQEPPYFFWLLMALIALLYLIVQFYFP